MAWWRYMMILFRRLLSPGRFTKQERTVVTSNTAAVLEVTRYALSYTF